MQLDITEAEVRTEVRQSLTELYDSIKPYYNATTSDGKKLTAAWWEAETGIAAKRIRDAMSKRQTSLANDVPRPSRDDLAVTRALRNRPEAVAEAIANLPSENRQALNEHVLRKTISNRTGKPSIPKERVEAKNASTAGYVVLHELGKAEEALTRALAAWELGEIDEDQRAEAVELLDRIGMATEGFKTHDWDAF